MGSNSESDLLEAFAPIALVIGTVVLTPVITLALTFLFMALGIFDQTEEGIILLPVAFVLAAIGLWAAWNWFTADSG